MAEKSVTGHIHDNIKTLLRWILGQFTDASVMQCECRKPLIWY